MFNATAYWNDMPAGIKGTARAIRASCTTCTCSGFRPFYLL